MPQLSIVVPLYNEDESLPHLKPAIDKVLIREKLDAEIIFVNDGSSDESLSIIRNFAREDKNVRVINFRRNRGKAAALDAAFRVAEGKYVVTMDADLQDDPEEIPNLIAKLEEGYDLVSGWKKKRYDPLSKTIPSKFFNWVVRKLSGVQIHDFNCGLKIYRNEVVKTLRIYGELHRFIPMMAGAQGWRVGEIVVQHHSRKWGVSKYGISRMLSGFLDMLSVLFITRYTANPMHLFGSFGIISIIIGTGILGYLSILWFMGTPIGHRPLFFLGILMMIVGIQFFSTGLIGELISHMHAMNQSRIPLDNKEES